MESRCQQTKLMQPLIPDGSIVTRYLSSFKPSSILPLGLCQQVMIDALILMYNVCHSLDCNVAKLNAFN